VSKKKNPWRQWERQMAAEESKRRQKDTEEEDAKAEEEVRQAARALLKAIEKRIALASRNNIRGSKARWRKWCQNHPVPWTK
jgi:hypothetical protein